MIDHNHPAVQALARDLAFLDDDAPWPSNEDLGGSLTGTRDDEFRAAKEDTAAEHIAVILPHLTSATPENLARLRDTPAGRALMAEGWQEGAMAHAAATSRMTPGTRRIINELMRTPNPYRT